MAQQVRALTAKPDSLGSILRTHKAGEGQLLRAVLWPPHDLSAGEYLPPTPEYYLNIYE